MLVASWTRPELLCPRAIVSSSPYGSSQEDRRRAGGTGLGLSRAWPRRSGRHSLRRGAGLE